MTRSFKRFVKVQGSEAAQRLARARRFPRRPEYKDLRGYGIDMNLPGTLANELDDLYDTWRAGSHEHK